MNMTERRGVVATLIFTTVASSAATIFYPAMPLIARDLDASAYEIQMLVGASFFGGLLFQLFLGPLADRVGARTLFLASFGVFTPVAGLAAAVVASWQLVALCFLFGFSLGGVGMVDRALIHDIFEETHSKRAFSYRSIAKGAVAMLAPVVGGFLTHYVGWRLNFGVLAILGLITFLVVWFFLRGEIGSRRHRPLAAHSVREDYRKLLTHRLIVGYLVIEMVLAGAAIAFSTAGPFLLERGTSLTVVGYGVILAILQACRIVGSLVNSHLVHRLATWKIVWTALVVAFLAGVVLLWLSLSGVFTVWSVVVPMMVVMFGVGLVYPDVVAEVMKVFRGIRGSASSLLGVAGFAGMVLASGLMVLFSETSPLPFSWVIASLMAVAVLSLALLVRHVDQLAD